MDYEKRYKEAVNKIRNLLDDGEKNGFTIVTYKTDLESIFPELKEPDDGEIRKALLNYMTKMWENSLDDVCGVHVGNVIAWLEKQSEKKPAWSEEDEEYINDLIGVFDGQQYQAHSDEEIVKWLKSIRLPYNKEWDENDEEMLRSIIATCELAEQDRDSSPARHLLEMQLDWLNSLKGKCTWKPSDEQMELLKDASARYEGLQSLYNDLNKLKGE